MMLRGPQHVEAEFVHGLRDVARREEGLAQLLVRIATLVGRRAGKPDVVELDLTDIEYVKFVDHRASAHGSFIVAQACFKTRRMATSAPSHLPFRFSCPTSRLI